MLRVGNFGKHECRDFVLILPLLAELRGASLSDFSIFLPSPTVIMVMPGKGLRSIVLINHAIFIVGELTTMAGRRLRSVFW